MSQQRQKDLQENLELLYEKWGMFQRELVVSANANQKFELKQRIKREIIPSIRRYETEYWELMTQDAVFVLNEEINETDAAEALAKVESAVTKVERADTSIYSREAVELLREIRTKLNEPSQSASAKLKATLPLIPGLLAIELEMDAEGVVSQTLQTVRKRFN